MQVQEDSKFNCEEPAKRREAVVAGFSLNSLKGAEFLLLRPGVTVELVVLNGTQRATATSTTEKTGDGETFPQGTTPVV